MADVLREIVEHKRGELERAKSAVSLHELERRLADAPAVRGFAAALATRGPVALIAEVKRASPSAGVIRGDIDPVAVGQTYERCGAACLSVLTDEKFFQGSLDDLVRVRQAVSVPVLRKDFLIDRYQVLEARPPGADCVLLIAECLDDCRLRDLYFYASEMGMDALVEIYDAENLERVLKFEPAIVGINNRDLRTFATDLNHTLELAPRAPARRSSSARAAFAPETTWPAFAQPACGPFSSARPSCVRATSLRRSPTCSARFRPPTVKQLIFIQPKFPPLACPRNLEPHAPD